MNSKANAQVETAIVVRDPIHVEAKPVAEDAGHSERYVSQDKWRRACQLIEELSDRVHRAKFAFIDNDPAVVAVRAAIAKHEAKKKKTGDYYIDAVKLSNKETEAVEAASNRFDKIMEG